MDPASFMNSIRNFFGLRPGPPVNDFRNPIWCSDDEDEEDDLYSSQNVNVYTHGEDLQEFANQMHDVFQSFNSIFGDMRSLFNDDHDGHLDTGTNTDNFEPDLEHYGNNIRDYYLKPGYNAMKHEQPKEDIDLDGKISSQEISGLLKSKDEQSSEHPPFNFNLVPGRSFCKTIITTSVTNPDGSVETRKIIKNGNEVIEETTTSTRDSRGPFSSNMDSMPDIMNSGIIYNHVMSELSSLFKNLH